MRDEGIENLLTRHRLPDPVYVTRPTMPELSSYHSHLEEIWRSRWLTNDGRFHSEFEDKLRQYLHVEHINLFVNGTIALLVALQALDIDGGEVLTTPFTFPATIHVLHWNRITPVFCDIDADTFNIDPTGLERRITPDTKAVLAVHVYGIPCDVEAIQSIADRHGLHVIYDAAHAFGVNVGDRSIVKYGDISALSFHATKLFTTIEGGALVSGTERERERIRFLKNFGISDEEHVIGPGINGKMNEFQAAFGLLELELVDQEIENRRRLTQLYRRHLEGIKGLKYPNDVPGVRHNYGFFPVLVEPGAFGTDRSRLSDLLRLCNVFPRKYFFPLCSRYPCYSSLPSASPGNLPTATMVADRVLCLPLYGDLEESVVKTICGIIETIHTETTKR